jgi:hypothetical protein
MRDSPVLTFLVTLALSLRLDSSPDVIGEGDQAATRWTLRGTHQGETEEFGPPTGKQVVEEWERYDNLSVLQQLGLMPEQ